MKLNLNRRLLATALLTVLLPALVAFMVTTAPIALAQEANPPSESTAAPIKATPVDSGEAEEEKTEAKAKANTESEADPETPLPGSIAETARELMKDKDMSSRLEGILDRAKSNEDLLRSAQERFRRSLEQEETKPEGAPPSPTAPPTVSEPVAAERPVAAETPAQERPVTSTVTDSVGTTSNNKASSAPVAKADQPPLMTPAQVASVDVPEPELPRSKVDKKSPAADENSMEILSDESTFHNQTRVVEFIGTVEVKHPGFTIWGDRLDVELWPEEPGAPTDGFKRAIATGAMVRIERKNSSGELEIATARKADYDYVAQTIVLSGGPPQLQSGERLVDAGSDDSIIILNLATGSHEVKGSKKRQTIIKLPVSNPEGNKQPGLPGGDLESIQSDRSTR